ncbi:carbohydrate binding family 9 domain-containing protein [Aquimarina sp. D1M17]|uniref:DUF5916 domain-containing protein n=1 Tax=Aquimarina acroporae TaxID=2937283 RepID=UPI0020C0A12A|nr:DUF5916 domain-containing protein [Aquimarina acroporae]MCK8521257.1 carbohydrate binding family 9 domain-containing protein [Aquimarina acroporae]
MFRLILILFLMYQLNGWSQNKNENFPPSETPIEVTVSKVEKKIKLDGILNEIDWNSTSITEDFFRREPRQGGKVRYKTEVRFLYDDKNLYIGAFCKDSVGIKGIRIQDLRRDFSWGENDIFGIALDPQNLKQYAQGFQTTPYGNQRDFQNFNGNNFDTGWNTLWRVRTQRTKDGYSVEMAIPFKSLRYNLPKEGATIEIGFTLVRYARRDIEVSSFPAIPQSFTPYRMTYAAKLTGIEAPPPSTNIRVEPYALYQYDETKIGDELTDKLNDPKIGFDAKWAINPKTVLDLTVNTDFAQADVDRAVNNLERFNIFFPERRQFFLENSGIWAGGLQQSIRPFFSRQIGLQGEFNATPAPIDAGIRFTQRTEKNALAGLLVRQRETDNSPGTNFGVFRYLKNYGRENNIGVMLTHRLDDSNNDLNLDRNNNTTITIDGQIRPTSQWDIQYLLSTSLDELTGETGFAGRIFIGNDSNKYYYGWVTEYTDENYNPRIGFVRQKDVIRHNPGGYFIWRPKKINWIRRWDPGMFINYNHDARDPSKFQQASLYIFPVFTWFKDNSFLEISATPTWQNINFDFTPLGLEIEQDNYFYTRYLMQYNTDLSKKWSADVGVNFGNFYNGTRTTINAAARFAPIPQTTFSLNYEYNDIRNVGIAEEDLETNLYTANLRLALNPRIQLSTFYQYNSFNEQGRWNARFSWEYMPLSFIYLVFNDTQTDVFDPMQQNTQFISKITFLKQF